MRSGQTLAPQALLFEPLTPGDEAVLFAFQQLGKPYIWGGNGPVGYDCSGLALASWVHGAGISFARVADDQYHTAGTQITFDQLEAGDLVFWGTNPTTGPPSTTRPSTSAGAGSSRRPATRSS